MKKIYLTGNKFKGKYVLVDDCDFELLSKFKWYGRKDGTKNNIYVFTTLQMHRVITNAKDNEIIDHKDGDSLNNTRNNLRKCNNMQNSWNSSKSSNVINSSIYKGVRLDTYKPKNKTTTKSWKCQLTYNNLKIDLGRFKSELSAARMYDFAANRLYGEFARLNFPDILTTVGNYPMTELTIFYDRFYKALDKANIERNF